MKYMIKMNADAKNISGILLKILIVHLSYSLIVLIIQISAFSPSEEQLREIRQLKKDDPCGTIFTGTVHGYQVKEYKVKTHDNYELTLHRLIHPSAINSGPEFSRIPKKPYILLHGLVGTSASFLTNVDSQYLPPNDTFDFIESIGFTLNNGSKEYLFNWQSTADNFAATNSQEKSKTSWKNDYNRQAVVNEIDFDSDTTPFARDFKQAYRKYNLPKASAQYTSNSLAMTLSNFGYDVWHINLRGNHYSRTYNGRYTTDWHEYWDFNVDTLVREDLLASINFVKEKSDYKGSVGFVSYSYTSMHILGLLTKFPSYQEKLQPVVMIAPTMLSKTPERSRLHKVMKFAMKALMSKNGPFPAIGRVKEDRIEKLICHLPLASKLCVILETIMYGKPKSLRTLVFSDRKMSLIQRDTECGQTSKAVLHQFLENLASESIDPNYSPFSAARVKVMQGKAPKRSVMLIHSENDGVSTMQDVAAIKDTALRLLVLTDYVIKKKDFSHVDFLFGQDNEYLVNAEIARMVSLFDYPAMSRAREQISKRQVDGTEVESRAINSQN